MSDKLNELGVPVEYHAHAKHFIGVFKDLGWTPTQIDEAIRWGVNFNGTPDERFSHFANFAEQQGISETDIGIAASWRDQVSEQGGVENMPQPPARATSPQADAARLHEIQEEMRKPRADSQYWKSAEMRDELRELLERAGPDAGEYTPGPTGNDRARRAEIEEAMRSDRALYGRSGMDREYVAILERTGEGDGSQYVPGPTGNDTARKAEIEALMRSDRAAYHRTNADREYLQILQRETGEQPEAENVSPQPNTTQEA